jgi:amidase
MSHFKPEKLFVERAEDESDNSEEDCDKKCVAAVLMRIEDDQAARVGGHARDEENRECGERGEYCPALAFANRDQREHDADESERVHESGRPGRGVFGQHMRAEIRVRVGVEWRGNRDVQKYRVGGDDQPNSDFALHDWRYLSEIRSRGQGFRLSPSTVVKAIGVLCPRGFLSGARRIDMAEKRDVARGRRKFLRNGLVGGVAAALVPNLSSALRPAAEVTRNDERATSSPAPVSPFEFDEITIGELHDGMMSGKYTARSITEKYLARIEEIDKHGPGINSVIEVNPDAIAIADALDKVACNVCPPLRGIPILIKDNIDTADRMMTTAGSLALVGAKPPKDSFVARKLREAGAVILGKTNPSEWANIRSSHSTSGWSGRGGLTRNPYALDRNPCGSSSGSGAATSANLCAGSIGTETDGSIVCPSSANGLVGIKPTVGLVSRAGIIPISHTQDSAGPMCRTVRDAAIVLGALVGVDPDDSATAASKGKFVNDYTKFLQADGLRGARIGVVRKYFGFSDTVDALMETALDAMKKQGAVLVDPADIETIGKTGDNETLVLLYELKADMNAYLAKLGPNAPVKTLKDIINFNERNREKEMPYFGQDMFTKAEAKGPLTTKEYVDALENNLRMARKEGIDKVLDEHNLAALVAPTGGPAWVTDLVNGDNAAGQSSTAAAVAGYPSVTVPAGFAFGVLPVGISFIGRAYSEPGLIRLAYAFEQATKVRKAPKFLPTIGMKA